MSDKDEPGHAVLISSLALEDLQVTNKRLSAEVERLTLADKQWADHVVRLADECDMLRASNKRLEARLDQILTLANLE